MWYAPSRFTYVAICYRMGIPDCFGVEVDRENVLSSRSMVEGDETVVVQLLSLGTF